MCDLKEIKKKFNDFRDWIPLNFIFIFTSIAFIFLFIQSIYGFIEIDNCDFLACNFKNIIYEITIPIMIVLSLPILIGGFISTIFPEYAILAEVISFLFLPYIFGLSLGISLLIRKIRKEPIKKITKKEIKKHIVDIGFFFTILFFIIFFIAGFLYYPRTHTEISLETYIIAATLVAALLALPIFGKKNIPNNMKYFGMVPIFMFILGAFVTFTSSFDFGFVETTELEDLIDEAQENSFRISSMSAGLVSLFFSIFLIIDFSKSSKRKTRSR